MFNLLSGPSMLHKVRTLSSTFFHHFGIHCATHQIRIILISSVVITSLFYPALAIYASSQHTQQSFSDSTSRILDSFLAASTLSGFNPQHDLRNIWEGYQALRIVEDAVSRAKCGKQRTLRVERILIQSPFAGDSDFGALNHQILQSTLNLEQTISKALVSHSHPCLKKSDRQCFVLSPLAFWRYEPASLHSDINILDTLSLSEANNISLSGIPVTPHMVLAGRGSYDYEHGDGFDYAKFLALTYFFPDSDCLGSEEHIAWLDVLKNAVGSDADIVAETQEPTLIALEYDTSPTRRTRVSVISLFLYLAYLVFFIYVARSMRDMVAVHSRIGLTFTALVEIAVSTITSLSVCALVGFRVTMVPWELLPIVIVFVGAENMFSLVDAVTRTSVTLPVKQRIALGLSHAGTSNTLKVVSYNAILGVVAVLVGDAGAGAIRQFCVFAIVVLVAHWFLAHTFFLAVLSIDIQRLELDELLRQNANLAPNDGVEERSPHSFSHSRWQGFILAKQNFFRRRVTKDISMVLLLAILATLYYTTYPASTRTEPQTNSSSPRAALTRPKPHANLAGDNQHPPAWNIWKTLNPDEDPLLHLRIEMPAILTFRSGSDSADAHTQGQTDSKHKLHRPRIPRPVIWFCKIVVLPITATTAALYFLCLYLLKDAELLEAQRNRAEPETPDPNEETPLEGQISFTTLPRAFATDVELVAASQDGGVIASVGMQNELVVFWRRGQGKQSTYVSVDTTSVLFSAASTSSTASTITAISVDEKGTLCAVGTSAGTIAVWSVNEGRVKPLPYPTYQNPSSGIAELHFIPATQLPQLLATYENGTAAKWMVDGTSSVMHIIPSHSGRVIRTMVLHTHSDSHLLLAFAMQDGSLELTDISDSSPIIDCLIRAGNPSDPIAKAEARSIELGGTYHLVIGAATQAGVISLWDGRTGECIYILDDVYGDISNLRISSAPCKTCHYCGELPLESFTIAFSVGQIVLFHRAYMSVQARRCSCARNLPRQTPSREIGFGRRSRSGSVVSVGSVSPSNIRSKFSAAVAVSNQSALDTSAFPVSAHGVHSRRASEKDSLRRAESLTLPLLTDEHESSQLVGPSDALSFSTLLRKSSAWHNLTVVRLADISCERGSWDVSKSKIMGVRRKARSLGTAKGGSTTHVCLGSLQGLSAAALDRWELWTFDPSSSRLQSSPLTAVINHHSEPLSRKPSFIQDSIPRLPFTRVPSFFSRGSHILAGFGNTIGIFDLSSRQEKS